MVWRMTGLGGNGVRWHNGWVSINFTQDSHFGRGSLNQDNGPAGLKSLLGNFLINDWCERAHPSVDSATPGLVVLGALSKQGEQAKSSQPVNSTPPWSLCLSLRPGSCLNFHTGWTYKV